MIFSGQASDGTIHTDQGKQPDRQKQAKQETTKTTITIQNHPQENKKNQKGKEKDDEPQCIREFNAALTNCKNEVWLMGANDESFNMKNEEEYIEGIIKLTEGHDDQLGIFTTSYEDEMTMMHFIEQMAA